MSELNGTALLEAPTAEQVMEKLIAIVQGATAAFPEDIDEATEDAMARLRIADTEGLLTDCLVRRAVREMIYNRRCTSNRTRRAKSARPEHAQKVERGSRAVLKVYDEYYGHFVAGRTLGSITGAELPGLAASERALADGHVFNAMLCDELAVLVNADQSVKDAVSAKKLKAIFAKVGKLNADAA